jgi:hypothetical protein
MKLHQLKELVRQVVREEQDYQQLFKHMLDKVGKSITDMSDDEKKKFFNAVDTAYKAKSEGRLTGYNEAELTAGQKKIDTDGDGEIEGSDLAALRAGKKSESVVKESIDTNYWIKYNKNPNGESSQSKKSNNFEYTFKDALNDWNSEGEDVVSGSDAQKIKKLAKEFFDKEGYITYNIVYAMIMQS